MTIRYLKTLLFDPFSIFESPELSDGQTAFLQYIFTANDMCILFTVYLVIIHVSELYNRTDLTQ